MKVAKAQCDINTVFHSSVSSPVVSKIFVETERTLFDFPTSILQCWGGKSGRQRGRRQRGRRQRGRRKQHKRGRRARRRQMARGGQEGQGEWLMPFFHPQEFLPSPSFRFISLILLSFPPSVLPVLDSSCNRPQEKVNVRECA
jgi:hypothetical protein